MHHIDINNVYKTEMINNCITVLLLSCSCKIFSQKHELSVREFGLLSI